MSTSVELPALGESVTEGTVSRWLKQVGDTVEADEALLEVSTDKVDTEIPAPVAGTLLEIKVAEDETVDVGTVLAIIGDPADDAGQGGQSDSDQPESSQPSSAESDAGGSDAGDASLDEADEHAAVDEQGGAEDSGTEQSSGQDSNAEASGGSAQSGAATGTEVTLPALGESVTEGTVSRWLKQVGDTVEADEALLEVSTDKVDTEIPAPVAGTLLEIKVGEDETVDVGTVLAVIGDASASGAGDGGGSGASGDESEPGSQAQTEAGDEGGQDPVPVPDAAPEPDEAPKPDAESKAAEPKAVEPDTARQPDAQTTSAEQADPQPGKVEPGSSGSSEQRSAPSAAPRASSDDDGPYVTPLVRKLASQHNIDLTSLTGTGVGGRIRKQDVLAAAEEAKQAAEAEQAAQTRAAEQPAASSQPSKPAATPSADAQAKRGTTEKMSRLRSTIAKRMVESLQVSAQLTATVEVDLTNISRLRARVKHDFAQREGAKLSYLPFISLAVVEALKQFPKLNATIDTEQGTVTYAAAENLGIAVDTEKGLMVPVIKDAGDLNLAGFARKISDLADRTRTNKVTPDDLTGGTFTITNYGSAGTLMDTPIINQPQVAILGTGALVKRPMVLSDAVLGETIAIRDMMYLSMSYDHRLVDGADAARFLSVVKARLDVGDFDSELGL